MCPHVHKVRMGDARVCLRCGMTFIPGKQPFFDRELYNYVRNREKKRNGSKQNKHISGL